MAAKKKKNTGKTASKATSRSGAKKKPKARSKTSQTRPRKTAKTTKAKKTAKPAKTTKTTKKKSTKSAKKASKVSPSAVDRVAEETLATVEASTSSSIANDSDNGNGGDQSTKQISGKAMPETDVENVGTFAARAFMQQLPSLSRIMSVVMLIFGIVAVGILFYRVMAVFFVPLFLAAALVVVFRPVHQWLLLKLNGRRRTAAVSTTSLITFIVLLPLIAIVSVAATQFTAMVSQLNFNDLTEAIERARGQFGLNLEHPEQFRRLDRLADTLDKPTDDEALVPTELLSRIDEAKSLVRFLQTEVEAPAASEAAEAIALEKLTEFSDAIRESIETESSSVAKRVAVEEKFNHHAVVASASIRSWMHSLLGGSFRSQAKLLANPDEVEFASLLSRTRETLQPRFVNFTSATGEILIRIGIGMVVLVIACYFFLIDGPAMIRTLMRLSPLDDEYELQLLNEFDKTSRAVVIASIASAVVQGLLAAIAFFFFGFQSFVLLFLITCLMALVPFLGAASVWIPCALYLGAVEQRWGAAAILAIYGAAVVSSVDNVIKAYVLHGHSQLHPLFALLSVLGGVHVFGPIGILVGPMVVVFLQTLLEILNHELGNSNADDSSSPDIQTSGKESDDPPGDVVPAAS